MIAGAFYVPHAQKRPLGEDAFFISAGGRVIGVADGVSAWRKLGVDAGEFARELMCRSESLVGKWPCGTTDPVRILDKAASRTTARGTATACVIALKGKVYISPDPPRDAQFCRCLHRFFNSTATLPLPLIRLSMQWLHAAVVGDSGFVVIRGGKVIYRSPQQQRSFNQPYQLGAAGSGDSPLDALVSSVG